MSENSSLNPVSDPTPPPPSPPSSPTAAVKFARRIERDIANGIISGLIQAIKISPISALSSIAESKEVQEELERIICSILPIDELVQKTEKCCENECPSCWTRFCRRFGFCSK
jgi:hypothetical protein